MYLCENKVGMRNKELIELRNKRVQERMRSLEKKYPKYRTECLIEMLAKEFYLAERTIENILAGRGTRVSTNATTLMDLRQMSLF